LRRVAGLVLGLGCLCATSWAANPPPVVTLTSPVSGLTLFGPTSIQLGATATSSDSTIASVTYSYGTTKIGASGAAPYTFTWKNIQPGTYSIKATAKDGLGVTGTSAASTITVVKDPGPTVTLVVAPKTGASLIGPLTLELSATATVPSGTIKSVAFFNGITKIGTSTTAPYTFQWKNVVANTYSFSAVATDSLGTTGSSPGVPLTVIPDVAPSVSLVAAPATGFNGVGPETINLVATATSADSTITSVSFFNGTNKIATGKSPPYTFAWTKVKAGTYALQAKATDFQGTLGQSNVVNITVAQDLGPSVAMAGPADGTTVVGPTTVKLTATANSSQETIKSVTYNYQGSSGAVKIGSASKLPYLYNWTAPVGTYSVSATATDSLGATVTSSPITITVTQDVAPVVSILTPVAGATYVNPATVALTASATSPDTTIASVTYYQGGTSNKIGTSTVPPFAYTWKPATTGTYSLTAVAKDTVGTTMTSAPVAVNVTATTSSTVKLTKPAGGTVAAPVTVSFAAAATAPAGVASVAFYQGNTLLGTATSTPYQYTWNSVPAGLYSLTAVETDAQGASITSAPVSLRVDTPPTVAITTPTTGSSFIGPTNINIGVLASSPGKLTKVEFFQGTTLLGTSTVAPYAFTWASAPLGTYALKAEAFDSYGIGAFSPVVNLQVIDQPPAISLSTPTTGLTFSPTAIVALAFTTVSSASVTKIEIYRNNVLVATLTSPSSGNTWSFSETGQLPVGKYSYYARAYDASGASSDSAMVTVVVAPNLPFLTDFEAADGFAPGPLDGQIGWANPQGSANITSTAYSGSQSVQLAGGSTAAVAQQVFAPATGETIIFCDFYALPAAEVSITSSTLFRAEGAQFGFQQAGSLGVLQIFRGDGNGGGSWASTTFSIPLNTSNVAQSWVRLTARIDFTRKTWDIYANGSMIAADVPLISSTATGFSTFQGQGDSAGDSFFDDMYVGPDNPLFADVNNDGIDDAWESAYGLSLAINDRNVNLSGDGIPIVQDFINNTSPFLNTKVTPPPVQSGLILDLRADAGVIGDANGNVSQWLDQSQENNIAYQPNTANQPHLAAAQINGLPSLSFNGSNALTLPYNLMQNAGAGEIVGVVRVANDSNSFGSLWNFGTAVGTSYSGTLHTDDFGTSDGSTSQVETQDQISQYFIYDASIAGGTSVYRHNGVPLWTRTGLAQGFQQYPDLGGYGTGNLIGNIAEVLVYNRVLSDSERFSIGQYLTSRYAFPSIVPPVAPTDLAAVVVSSDAVDVSWSLPNPGLNALATVYRQTGTASFVQIAQLTNGTSYADAGLTGGTSYSYKVTLQGYAGTSGPSNTATVTTPSGVVDLPTNGLTLWLRSTVGTEGAGGIATWSDQSGQGNDAAMPTPAIQPQLVENQVNGLPVVRFSGSNELLLPPNTFQNAQGAQVIALVKVTATDGFRMLWNFGTGYGSTYAGSGHLDDLGTSDTSSVQVQPTEQIAQYYVYDSSIDPSGNSLYRYDGTLLWSRTGLPISFQQYPDIGGYGGNFVGDIAEIIVYDRVLSASEQSSVYGYFSTKYGLPSVVTNLNAPAITSTQTASGIVNQPFTFAVVASNNPTGYTASGLPGGLTLNPTTGVISGTPTSQGTFQVAITATNTSGTGSSILTISIADTPPTISSLLTAAGQEGVAFSYQIQAGDATGFTSIGLPSGLGLDSNLGLISGTPAPGTAGSYMVLLSASNTAGSGPATLTLTINPGVTLTSAPSATGQVGQAFSYQVTTSVAATGFTASGLPSGLVIDPNAGAITGTPTAAGVYVVRLSLTTAGGTSTATMTISVTPNFPVVSGMKLWLRSDTGVVADASGNISQWADQSGLGNNAFQTTTANDPQLVANQLNGLPAIQFNGANSLSLPFNMMQQAQAGQIIAVVRVANNPNVPNNNTLWNFGMGFGSTYSGTNHYEDFGSSDTNALTVETLPQISQYFVYDTSIDANGNVVFRNDGAPLFTKTVTAGGFQPSPDLGGYGAGNFYGQIVEVIVYDRVLTGQEQGLVYSYLASRYAFPTSVASSVGAPVVIATPSATITVGQTFSLQISASNGPTSFGASGLPPGLQISGTGLISGSPTAAGAYPATLTATNASGTGSTPVLFTINPPPPSFAPGLSASGQEGQSFSYQIVASNNPTGYTSGALPSGLSLDPIGGVISGTPAIGSAGTYNVAISASNQTGSASTTLTITISAAPVSAPVITGSTTFVAIQNSAFIYQVVGIGATSYSATGLPAGLTINTSTGLISGTPTTVGPSSVVETATNSIGTWFATVNFIVTSSLVYSTGFESGDLFSVGSIAGQNGWTVTQGDAEISTQDTNSGSQSLQLAPGGVAAIAGHSFPASQGETIMFCDFYAKPTAEATLSSSTTFTVEGAQFGFQLANGVATLEVYQGNGSGGGNLVATQFTAPLGAGSQLSSWIRLTARLDFTQQTWDLYANGKMVAASIPFTNNSSTHLSAIQIQGDPTTASYVDDVYVGATNPLFADINNDGIDDAWETRNGLSLSTNDRNGDPSGGGVSNVQKYIQGTSPLDFFNGMKATVVPLVTGSTAGIGAPGPNDDLAMLVLKPDGTPWINAPATFRVTSGNRQVSVAHGVGPYVSTLTVYTDTTGVARVYLQPLVSQ
jgi:Bacterial Ig domain/Putative Ig domain